MDENKKETNDILEESIESVKAASKNEVNRDNDIVDEDSIKNDNVNVSLDEECNSDEKRKPQCAPKKLAQLAAILSFFPGLGQFYARKYKKGCIILVAFVVSVILLFIIFMFTVNIINPEYLSIIPLSIAIFWAWNIWDAGKTTNKYNKLNNYQESKISDKLHEYGLLEKIALLLFKSIRIIIRTAIKIYIIVVKISIIVIVKVIAKIVISFFNAIYWFFGRHTQCPKCGTLYALEEIDREYDHALAPKWAKIGSQLKTDYSGNNYKVQTVYYRITLRCKKCGYTKQKMEKVEEKI